MEKNVLFNNTYNFTKHKEQLKFHYSIKIQYCQQLVDESMLLYYKSHL